nr:hypothetical protein [Tanacetum cinerariifolium]
SRVARADFSSWLPPRVSNRPIKLPLIAMRIPPKKCVTSALLNDAPPAAEVSSPKGFTSAIKPKMAPRKVPSSPR